MSNQEYEECMDEIDKIEVEVEDFPVVIRTVESNQVKVKFPVLSDLDEVSYETVDRRFRVTHRMRHEFSLSFFLLHHRGDVIVDIPSNYQGSILVKTCNGSIKAEGVVDSSEISLITSNGSIKGKELRSNVLSLNSMNGSIHIDQMAADDILIETKNGSIKGLIMGDANEYTIDSHTSNGSNNLPQHMQADGEKRLSVKTSNGKIAIDFVKKLTD